ncbi:hypothetical protein LPJ59_004294 [Coemansia sp. RSA 2399]|nr:hypothetical protein LPJ59_004294 [Coemansia sp. RSA 2399]
MVGYPSWSAMTICLPVYDEELDPNLWLPMALTHDHANMMLSELGSSAGSVNVYDRTSGVLLSLGPVKNMYCSTS